ncbi:MAG: UPF0182 family protein, partial [Clostridia bacterium]|nr:UPF0182 family protein [Clostridia bacterium]
MNFQGFHFDEEKSDFKETFSAMKKKKGTLIFWAVLLVAISVIGAFGGLIMDYIRIREVGEAFTSVFWTDLLAQLLTRGIGVLLVFLVVLINLYVIKKVALDRYFHAPILQKKWPRLLIALVISVLLSGLSGGDLYRKFLMAASGESFGITDPLFAKDIGYYLFQRPFLIGIVGGLKTLLLLLLAICGLVYFIVFVKNGHKSLKEVITMEKSAVFHILVLAVLYFLLAMVTYQFSAENLLYSSFGSQSEIVGAGYVETNIWRQYYRFAPFVVFFTVVLVLLFAYRKKYLFSVCSLALVPVVYLAVSLVAVGVDSLVVSPNERNLQTPYITHNMAATAQAFGLSEVTEREFFPSYSMSQDVITQDDTWQAGTRIADFGSTLQAYNQLQFMRKYYTFQDVDVAPYELDGKLNVIFLAAREMNKENLDQSAQSYANQIFRYTHGFGAVASPVNRVTAEGQPEFLIKDIPPKSTGGMPEIKQPRIYYGELTNDYVVVGGKNRELDYSEGLTDVEFTYDGEGGVKLNFFNRLLFSAYYKDYRMLFSGNVSSSSRILITRNVRERVSLVAPFAAFDDDPYLIISDEGKLYWILNGYTYSRYYPYAQSYEGVNYLRNSITATVDAYTGEVKLYIIDEADPVALTYRNIYPEVFETEPLPESIRNHTRVPEYMFRVQSEIFERYHVKDAGQFYDRADVWDIATEKYQDNEISMAPYYNIMEIDGEDEMVLMLPFVVQGKHNMVGILVQRNTPEHYGELMLYRFPKNETIYGPLQIENRIDNDPDISREMTLWGQGGSSVIRGNLLVVPFRDALIYVEPIYITSKNNASLPELKRVVVAYGDAIAMEPTLEAALRSVFAKRESGSVAPD